MRWEKNATLCSPPPSVYLSVFILYLCSSWLSLCVLSFLCCLLHNFFSLILSIYLSLHFFFLYLLRLHFKFFNLLFLSLYFFHACPNISTLQHVFSPEIIEFSKLRWQCHFYAHIFFQLISCLKVILPYFLQ